MAGEKPRRRSRLFSEGLERINAFSDGIFAIAITLLVLDIHVPELASKDQLPQKLWDLIPSIRIYCISFLVIGAYWMLHRGLFSYIRRYDRRLLWLNNFFLLTIAFQPFPTAVLGQYGDTTAVVFYASVQILSGIFKLLIWVYASYKHRLIDPDLSDRFIHYYIYESISTIFIFALSFGLAFINSEVAMFSWLLLALDGPIIRLIYPLEPDEDEEYEAEVVATDFGEVPAEVVRPSTSTFPPSAAVKKESAPPQPDK